MGAFIDQVQKTNSTLQNETKNSENLKKEKQKIQDYFYKLFCKRFEQERKEQSNDFLGAFHELQTIENQQIFINSYKKNNIYISDYFNEYELVQIYNKILNDTYKIYLNNFNLEKDIQQEELKEKNTIEEEQKQRKIEKENKKIFFKKILLYILNIFKWFFIIIFGGIILIFKFISDIANDMYGKK